MKITWHTELIHWLLVAAMFAVAALAWSHVPERIAIHWNLQGEADDYGGKFAGLLLLPLMTLGLYLLLLFLPRLDPGYRNYQSFATTYHVIRVSLTLFMALVYAITVLVALGYRIDVTAVVAIATGALLVVMGNFMGKLRPNWFVGVRTPWTLSSKLSWTKTHRLAGWLFILLGTLIAATGVLRTDWMLGLTIAVGGVSLVWIVAYSYFVWRKDPTRTTPAGTSPSVE
jgi:uncharacterized membrane protein